MALDAQLADMETARRRHIHSPGFAISVGMVDAVGLVEMRLMFAVANVGAILVADRSTGQRWLRVVNPLGHDLGAVVGPGVKAAPPVEPFTQPGVQRFSLRSGNGDYVPMIHDLHSLPVAPPVKSAVTEHRGLTPYKVVVVAQVDLVVPVVRRAPWVPCAGHSDLTLGDQSAGLPSSKMLPHSGQVVGLPGVG